MLGDQRCKSSETVFHPVSGITRIVQGALDGITDHRVSSTSNIRISRSRKKRDKHDRRDCSEAPAQAFVRREISAA